MDNLLRDHPWLRFRPDRPSDYMRPEYYDLLLKEYAFEGLTDLELVARFLNSPAVPKGATLLELGCGSGRATAVLLAHAAQPAAVDLVDLSRLMVAHCSAKYATIDAVHVHQRDAVDFLAATPRIYDRAVSLWNLSHSIHQHMLRDGIQGGSERTRAAVDRFLEHSLAPGSRAFLIQKIGERIRISGGGHCNFTNRNAGPENFLSQNPHFVHPPGPIRCEGLHQTGGQLRHPVPRKNAGPIVLR